MATCICNGCYSPLSTNKNGNFNQKEIGYDMATNNVMVETTK